MSTGRPPRLPAVWLHELNASGIPWTLEPKKRHYAVILGGKMICVISRNRCLDKGRHDTANTLATIRRAVAAHKLETRP